MSGMRSTSTGNRVHNNCVSPFLLLLLSLSFFLLLAADLPPLLLKLLSCKIEWTAGRIKNETWHRGRTNLEEGHCCWLHLKRWRQSVSHIGLRKVKMSRDERPKVERKVETLAEGTTRQLVNADLNRDEDGHTHHR